MADFILAPGEELIQCPYNTAHQITNARLHTHLHKCRQAYSKYLSAQGRQMTMKICRYNSLHHVPEPELKYHEEGCIDGLAVARHLSFQNSEEAAKQLEQRRQENERPIMKSLQAAAQEEDWEAECSGDAPGYDPEVKLKAEAAIYIPVGLTKSERKKFYKMRQQAVQRSLTGEKVEFPTACRFDYANQPDFINKNGGKGSK